MMLFLIAALRALVEMIGLCLLAQAVLYLMAGQNRTGNPIYQLFSLITKPPRAWLARLLPAGVSAVTVGVSCFVLFFFLWIGLALIRKLI